MNDDNTPQEDAAADDSQEDQSLMDKVTDAIPGQVDDKIVDAVGTAAGAVGDAAGAVVDKVQDMNPMGGSDDDAAAADDSADSSADEAGEEEKVE